MYTLIGNYFCMKTNLVKVRKLVNFHVEVLNKKRTTYFLSYSFKNNVTAYCIILCLFLKGYLLIPVAKRCIPKSISAIEIFPFWMLCKRKKKFKIVCVLYYKNYKLT